MAEALTAFDAATNEALVLETLSKTSPGRFMLIRGAMTPKVIARTIEICKDLASNAQASLSALKELHTIPLEERGPLKEAILASEDPPSPAQVPGDPIEELLLTWENAVFLKELTVDVNYVSGEEALELFQNLTHRDYVHVASDFDYYLDTSFLIDALRNRRSADGFYKIREYTIPVTNLYQPLLPEIGLKPRLKNLGDYSVLAIAKRDSRLAIQAGLFDIPVVDENALPTLLGAPLHHVKESLPNLLRRSRESMELYHHHFGEPVSDDVISEVEEFLGFGLPESLKTFYKNFNGTTIYMPAVADEDDVIFDLEVPLPEEGNRIFWRDFMDREKGPIFPENLARYEGFPMDQNLFYFYTVNILPLEEIFLKNDWENPFPEEKLFLFDGFDDRRHALLHVYPKQEKILVRLVDEDKDLFKYLPLTPEEYLEEVIARFERRVYQKGAGVLLKKFFVEPNL